MVKRLLRMKNIIFTFFILYTGLCHSQNIVVSEGLDVRTDQTYELLGHFGDKYMVASYSGDEFMIHNYNQELYLTSSQEFNLPNKRSRIIHIYPYENRYNVLYSEEDHDTLYVVNQSYQPNFEKIKADTLLKLDRNFQNYSFRYTFSDDESKFGLTAIRSNEITNYVVYDVKYQETVHRSSLDMAEFDFYDDYRKSLVTNSGIFYLIFEQNNFLYKKEDHAFFIYKFRDAGEIEQSILPMKTLLTYDA